MEAQIKQTYYPLAIILTILLTVFIFSHFYFSEITLIIIPLVIISIFTFLVSDQKKKIAFYFILIIQSVLLYSDEDISIYEIGYFGIWTIVSTIIFIKTITTSKNNLLQRIEVKFLIAFIIYSVFLFPISILGIGDPIYFIRELLTFIFILNAIHLEHFEQENQSEKHPIFFLIVVSTIIGLYTLYNYNLQLSIANYFWEIVGSRKALYETLYLTTAITSISLLLVVKSNLLKGVFLVAGLLNIVALIVTFSRAYWIGLIIAIGILILLFPIKKSRYIISSIGITIGIAGFIAYLFYPELAKLVYNAIIDRFLSVTTAITTDLSFLNRIQEWKHLLNIIKNSPIVGYGFGAEFSFHDILVHYQKTTFYSHNFYLYLIFKTGLIGLSLYLLFYFNLIKSLLDANKKLELPDYVKAINFSFISILITFLILANNTSVFIQRDTILVLIVILYYNYRIYQNYRPKIVRQTTA